MMTAEQEMQRIRQNKRPYTPYGAARVLWGNRSSEILIEGPAGCVAGETRLYLADKGQHVPIQDLWEQGIAPVVMTINGPCQATVPFLKGVARLFKVTFHDGASIVVTEDHKFLGCDGWIKLKDVSVGDVLMRSSAFCPSSVSGLCPSMSLQDDERSIQTTQGLRDDYRPSFRSYGGLLGVERELHRELVPSQVGVLEHNRVCLRGGVQASRSKRIRFYQSSDPLATPDCCDLTVGISYEEFLQLEENALRSSCLFSGDGRSQTMIIPVEQDGEVHQDCGDMRRHGHDSSEHRLALGSEQFDESNASIAGQQVQDGNSAGSVEAQALCHVPLDERFPYFHSKVQQGTVSSIEFVREDLYFDLHVPGEEHYLAEGVWNHNTGKTRACLEKIFFMLMKYPGSRGLIVRKTREAMTTSVLVTLEEKVIPAGSPILEGPQRKLRTSYVFPNGSELDVGGMDKSSKVMSTEYDVIGVFEATELTEEDYENLTSRLRNYVIPYQQIIADCNPGPPSHWLNRRANDPKKGIVRLKSYHRDNPVFFDMKLGDFNEQGKAYLKKLSNLTGVRRLRLLEGLWRAAEGAVYGDWRNDLHMVDELPAGWEQWRKVRSIDFGFNNPFVCLWGAVDPDGDIYIYRQMYMTQRTVNQHAKGVWNEDGDKRILLHEGIIHYSEGEEIEATVADHDREDRATLEEAGINTLPAYKEIEVGIEAVKERLRPQLRGSGKILPRIFILRGCLAETDTTLEADNKIYSTEQEFDAYVYEKAKEGKAAKEVPVDKDNHGLDALRYLVAYVDNLAGDQISVVAEEPAVVS